MQPMYMAGASKIRHVNLLMTLRSCRGAGFHQQIASKQSARVYLATPWRICSCTIWQALWVAGRSRVVSVKIYRRRSCEDRRRMQRLPADARFSWLHMAKKRLLVHHQRGRVDRLCEHAGTTGLDGLDLGG
jgi:serine/threonine-protein kinase RIO1